jgi:hypothetical protein
MQRNLRGACSLGISEDIAGELQAAVVWYYGYDRDRGDRGHGIRSSSATAQFNGAKRPSAQVYGVE